MLCKLLDGDGWRAKRDGGALSATYKDKMECLTDGLGVTSSGEVVAVAMVEDALHEVDGGASAERARGRLPRW